MRSGPLRARDVREALDRELLPRNIEGTRAQLKRSVRLGTLTEIDTGSFARKARKAVTDQGPRPAWEGSRPADVRPATMSPSPPTQRDTVSSAGRARTRFSQASRSLTISCLLVSWNSSWRASG